jgi:hypothetical protein
LLSHSKACYKGRPGGDLVERGVHLKVSALNFRKRIVES